MRSVSEIVANLIDGSVDLGLVRCPPDIVELESRSIRLERQVVLLRRDHPLASRSSLDLTDLQDEVLALHPSDGDDKVIRELFAADATWRLDAGDLPVSGTWNGREPIMDEFLGVAMSHYQSGSVDLEITAMIAQGDRVVLQWTSRARTLEEEPYENGCIAIFTVRDGKIQTVRDYMDTLYASSVLEADLR